MTVGQPRDDERHSEIIAALRGKRASCALCLGE
jgi:hypothetical protein